MVSAVRLLAEELIKDDILSAYVYVQGRERRLKSETELGLYRMIQEALNNVRKHAGTQEAMVVFEFCNNKIVVKIIDNGTGFQINSIASDLVHEGKLGLIGMRERARLIGARFYLKSQPDVGTTVTLELDT